MVEWVFLIAFIFLLCICQFMRSSRYFYCLQGFKKIVSYFCDYWHLYFWWLLIDKYFIFFQFLLKYGLILQMNFFWYFYFFWELICYLYFFTLIWPYFYQGEKCYSWRNHLNLSLFFMMYCLFSILPLLRLLSLIHYWDLHVLVHYVLLQILLWLIFLTIFIVAHSPLFIDFSI